MSNLKSKIENLKWAIAPLFRRRRRGRLVRHYFLISLLLIAGGLISSAVLEIYFRYRESQEQIARLEREAAAVAALKIDRFVQDIVTAIKASTKSREVMEGRVSPEYKFELKRLFYLAPAITEAVALDLNGVKQAQVSRAGAVSQDSRSDFTASPGFQRALQGKPDYGPVYFVQNSEPYMTIAFPIEQFAGTVIGVLQAEVNLKHVWDVVSNIKAGEAGYAYVVSRSGDLISHRDISLVLQRRNLGHLRQVRAAFLDASGAPLPKMTLAYNMDGKKVISSYAFIPSLQWVVIIERPAEEAYTPLYASMIRTSALLLVGFSMAFLASLFVARRVVRPLEALRWGAERIGKGDLNYRLDLKTGDEVEILADEFNEMAAHLKQAYSGLEQKVAERTEALTIANEKLVEASNLKSQFLANVNHELRTPVSAIIGYGGLVLSDTDGRISPLQNENLQDLLNNAERLLNLIDSLLDFAKIEAGKMDVRIEPIELEEIIQGAVATIESTLNKNSVRVIREVAPDLPVLNTDREKLRRIILNLLDNAVKFTERGEIKISAAQQNGALKLVVSDRGMGIPKGDLNRVFEEFHRGASTAKNYRGTGLGLAIVKRLVSLLGGDIEVSSEVGAGSTFTVTLPFDYKEGPSGFPVANHGGKAFGNLTAEAPSEQRK
jgi:signal transduction histidine kinase